MPKSHGRSGKKAKHRRAVEHGRELRREARKKIAKMLRQGFKVIRGRWYGAGVYAGHHPYSSSRSKHRSGGKPRK